MLVCLVGPQAAGKTAIANVLVEDLGFTRVRVGPQPGPARDGILTPPSASTSKASAASARDELHFRSAEAFLDYSTLNWRKDFVTTDLRERDDVEIFVKRPWFLAVAVEAGIVERWRRAVQRAELAQTPPPSLESFVAADDLAAYGPTPPLSDGSGKGTSQHRATSPTHINLPNGDLPPSTLLIPPSSDPRPSPPSTPQPPAIYTLRRSSDFVTTPIAHLHTPTITPLRDLLRMTTYTITNTTPSLIHLRSSLRDTVAHLRTLLRPSWDSYFMTLAGLASLRSNCMKRRVGAVLVTNREKRVLSTGYNGTPRGMTNCGDGGCARCNGTLATLSPSPSQDALANDTAAAAVARCGVDLNECLCLHAEENALLEAGRERAGQGDGSTLYCNTCPCLRCSVKIVQCGVREVCYAQGYSMDAGTAAIFKEAGVKLRQLAMVGT